MSLACGFGRHNWITDYLGMDSCIVQERCSGCGAVIGEAVVVHKWGWIDRNPCLSQQVCERCGEIGQTDEKTHQWRETGRPSSYEIQKTCERCGLTDTHRSAFSKFIGQDEIKLRLFTLVTAARKKGEPLHHLLLCGHAGMGKGTLALAAAADLGMGVKVLSGQTIAKAGDFAAILTNLRQGDFLKIEQIESMQKQALEVLIPAAADFSMDIVIGKGASARNIRLKLPHFTLVGTTAKPSLLDARLGNLMFRFDFSRYDIVDVAKILSLSATQQGVDIQSEAAHFLAEQSNGCPGEALVALRKVHEYAIAYDDADGPITLTIARNALAVFGSNTTTPAFDRLSIPSDVRMFVWRRDEGRCAECGSQENLEFDHIIPVSKGGSSSARNIQLLCEKCNRSKGANIA